jgi:hypothetical protein
MLSFFASDPATAVTQAIQLNSSHVPSASIVTAFVSPNTNYIQITCHDLLPYGVPFFLALMPVDASLLSTVMGVNAVSNVVWNNRNATSFTDRFVLHPERYTVPSPLHLQVLPSCPALTESAYTIVCTIPPNLRGSLLCMYLGWGIPIGPAQYAISQLFPVAPLMSNQYPLTLTFDLPRLGTRGARRFLVNTKVIPSARKPPAMPFVPESVEYVSKSPFDLITVSNTSSYQLSLNPVPQTTEELYLTGSMSLAINAANLEVFLRY